MKLYFVDGIRHSAVVLASNAREAVELATKEHGREKPTRVLFGSVAGWEVPTAHELRLPEGYRITSNED